MPSRSALNAARKIQEAEADSAGLEVAHIAAIIEGRKRGDSLTA